MTDRRRNTLILLIVAGLIAASFAVIATKKTRLGLDLKGGVELVYQAKPTAQSKVDAESLNRAIDIMRKRVDQLGVAQPEIQRSGADEIDVALPTCQQRRTRRTGGRQDRAAVLLRLGAERDRPRRQAGADRSDASPAASKRAARRSGCPSTKRCCAPRSARRSCARTTRRWSKGCTPQQVGGCIYGSWYLLEPKNEKVLRGPEETEKNLYRRLQGPGRGRRRRPCASTPARCSCRRAPSKAPPARSRNKSPNSWYVLNDDPVLTGADITNPHAELRRRRRRHAARRT